MLQSIFSPSGLVFIAALVVGAISGGNIAVWLLLGLGLALCLSLYAHFKSRSRLEQNSRESYIQENPSCNIGAKLACNRCSSRSISPRTDKKHPDFWAHECGTCGATLFHTHK